MKCPICDVTLAVNTSPNLKTYEHVCKYGCGGYKFVGYKEHAAAEAFVKGTGYFFDQPNTCYNLNVETYGRYEQAVKDAKNTLLDDLRQRAELEASTNPTYERLLESEYKHMLELADVAMSLKNMCDMFGARIELERDRLSPYGLYSWKPSFIYEHYIKPWKLISNKAMELLVQHNKLHKR